MKVNHVILILILLTLLVVTAGSFGFIVVAALIYAFLMIPLSSFAIFKIFGGENEL